MAEELSKDPDQIFCPECGRAIPRESEWCPICHANFEKLFADSNNTDIPSDNSSYPGSDAAAQIKGDPAKNKVVAVVLAVFLSFWSWLYTYGKNKIKFWSAIGVYAILFMANVCYSCTMIQDSMYYEDAVTPDSYFTGGFLALAIFINIVYFGIWLWAVLDNALKPESFYRDYPNG